MSTLTKERRLLAVLALALGLGSGCDGGEATTDAGRDDAGMEDNDAGPAIPASCANYCSNITANCTGANQQYADEAECLAVCAAVGWATGEDETEAGPLSGNTIGCRQYHSGVPAESDPELHCPHASENGANVCGEWCQGYCELVLSLCTDGNQVYTSGEDCMAACTAIDAGGSFGDEDGDSVQCRNSLLGRIARDSSLAGDLCPAVGAAGGDTCTGGWTFSTTEPDAYVRVDAMGMPAVSTALVSSGMKNAYNDASPINAPFVPDLAASLTGLHAALDDDLGDLGLTPCSMAASLPVGLNSNCFEQEIAPGVSVASLVVPDDLTLDLDATSSFPNGRGLTEPVIDITLAVILLDVDVTGAAGIARTPPHNPASIVGALNVTTNDVPLPAAFPYFAPPHQP